MYQLANLFGMPHVGASITPRQPYTQSMTRQATNQSLGMLDRNNSLYSMLKQFDRPQSGFSRGPASLQNIAGPLAQYRAQRLGVQAGVPLQDAQQNAQSLLAGQSARDQEGNALGSLVNQERFYDQQQQYGQGRMLMSLLQQLLGGV